ncbi:MAG: hypothetical protein J7M40_13920 [Planctomycetes bacterium]|nr:hypothetical protein [Planctomycetota bacterium]
MAENELGESGIDYFQQLKRKIDPACSVAIKYLKKPNDFDKIEGLDELLPMARRNKKGFAERLSERANESQEIIDAIWRNIDYSDSISHVNAIAAVVSAIEKNPEVIISPAISGKMAVQLSRTRIQDLENMSGNVVYERILRGYPAEIIEVVTKLGKTVNEFILSQKQITYGVDVMEAILKDVEGVYKRCRGAELSKLKQEIPQAIERLVGLGDEILPIAIKYPKFKSKLLFNKSLERCNEGYLVVSPDDIIEYCMALEDTIPSAIGTVIQCFNKVLGYFQNEEEWDSGANEEVEIYSEQCLSFLKALQSINSHAYEHDMAPSDSEATLQTLGTLFDYVDDSNKLEIIHALGDFEKYERWSGTQSIAQTNWTAKGKELLEEGSEESILMFIEGDGELVEERLHKFLPTAANTFKSVCDQVLNRYPDRRGGLITTLWGNRRDWVSEWIKENASKMDRLEKGEIQGVLFGIADNNEYDIVVYQTLRNVRIGNDGEAKDARIRHFDKLLKNREQLIDERELLMAAELEFVMQRIDEASYTTTNDQNKKLKESWSRVDQGTASKELKRLASKVIRR